MGYTQENLCFFFFFLGGGGGGGGGGGDGGGKSRKYRNPRLEDESRLGPGPQSPFGLIQG